MALLHHAVESPELVERWAVDWAARLPEPAPLLSGLSLRRGFQLISETLSNQESLNLWDVLFKTTRAASTTAANSSKP